MITRSNQSFQTEEKKDSKKYNLCHLCRAEMFKMVLYQQLRNGKGFNVVLLNFCIFRAMGVRRTEILFTSDKIHRYLSLHFCYF